MQFPLMTDSDVHLELSIAERGLKRQSVHNTQLKNGLNNPQISGFGVPKLQARPLMFSFTADIETHIY